MYEVIKKFGHYEVGKKLNITNDEQAKELISQGLIKESTGTKDIKVKTKELKLTK